MIPFWRTTVSSIRPLATITVLAFVGVFLYLKINETEPALPAGVESWSIEEDIQIGNSTDVSGGFEITETSPTSATTSGSAPPFQPGPTGEAPAFDANSVTAASSQAAAWSPEQVTTEPTLDSKLPSETTSEATGSKPPGDLIAPIEVPDLPPLPEIPAMQEESTSAHQEVPSLTTPEIKEQTSKSAPATDDLAEAKPPAHEVVPNQTQSSLFAATRLAVQSALDRGELSQALLLLSDWYGDPSLSPSESKEMRALLSQLAGSVIYSTEPRLEAPYRVQAGETLEEIAKKYEVPWQLLAKINGISNPNQVLPGQELKVVRGPFSAVVDFSKRKLTLMLDRRYAGEFTIEFEPGISIEEGHWTVSQKLLTPTSASLSAPSPGQPTEDRSLTLANASGESNHLAIIRGASQNSPPAEPLHRVIRLKSRDVSDIFDILSLGSKVIIRR
ncbi:MAG TPA: hypothetical protein DHW22_11970 [Planctomycetaceae bacterium]|nr:hypothetical protein [Planctomycetaceae bacterium]